MAKKTIYKFVSYAFKEDFITSKLPSEWQATNIITESSDTKAKTVTGGGTAFIYKYGAITFIDVEPEQRTAEIEDLRHALGLKLSEKVTTEDFIVEESNEKPKVLHNKLVIDDLTPERMAAISQVLGQSAALEYYEGILTENKQKVLNLLQQLQDYGKINISTKQLYKIIGNAAYMRNEVIGVLHLLDKPGIIWDDSLMDKLYGELRTNFDLEDRFQALEYKLQVIQETLGLLVETVKDSRLYVADLVIIGLILVEVLLSLVLRGW